jgi:hypothetical protein
MPRSVALLCLILAFAGQPLRQAEAAGDFARALAHLAAGGTIEMIDGGVGDDPGEATLKAGSSEVATPALSSSGDLWGLFDGLSLSSPLLSDAPVPGASRFRKDQPVSRTIGGRARHAWLQLFLI